MKSWLKNETLSSGVIVGFWVMENIQVNLNNATAYIEYKGYLNEESYESGKQCLITKYEDISLAGSDFNEMVTTAILQKLMSKLSIEQ